MKCKSTMAQEECVEKLKKVVKDYDFFVAFASLTELREIIIERLQVFAGIKEKPEQTITGDKEE
jgi:hypothetical protein